VDIQLNTAVEAIEKNSGQLAVHTSGNAKQVFEADMVVHGAGACA